MGSFPFSIGTIGTDWANDVLFGEWVPNVFDKALTALGVSGWLYGLVMDGILAGVGSVLGFVPQILVLSLLLSILEDVGYMSRVAFIMDRLLRKFGLSGKSIIPMLVGTGCSVPGILASRTIEQDNDRKITVMTTGFIPCGAKMPIIGLFAGAVFGNSPLVATSAFFIGVMAVVLSGVILKKFKTFSGKPAPFVMELPTYHLPLPRNILRTTLDRGWDFVKRATTIVLLSSIVLWFLQNFGFVGGSFAMVSESNQSLLANVGKIIAWIFYPLGWMGDMAWKATVATITGLIAKEEVVMTFGTLYNFGGEISEAGNEIWTKIAADFGPVRAYSFMIFNLLCAPCFAAIGAIKREMGTAKWTLITIGYMTGFAYAISMIVYQLGGLLLGEANFSIFTILAVFVLVALLFLIFRKGSRGAEKE
jgi:ferrous iron transport protein B